MIALRKSTEFIEKKMTNRAKNWLAQAEDDFLWMQDTFSHERFSQVCSIARK